MSFSPSLLSLVAFAAWTQILVLLIGFPRGWLVLRGRAANRFHPAGEDVSPMAARIARAHMNCVENLPIFGAVIVGIELLGRSAITDPLAPVFIGLRLVQSVVHMASTTAAAVMVRFTLYSLQVGIVGYWVFELVRKLSQHHTAV
jgi:uncharacterized MAPEG superfamily protein